MVIYYNNIYSIKEERLENFISDKILQSYTSRSLQQLDSFIIKNYKIVTYKLSSNYYGFFIFEKGLNNKYKFVVSSIKKCYFRTFNLEGNQINDYFIIGENIYTDKILCEIDIGNKIIKRGVDTGYFVIWVEIDSKLTTSIDKIKFYNNNIDVTNVIIRGGTDRDSK
jgi:hypothetical protein